MRLLYAFPQCQHLLPTLLKELPLKEGTMHWERFPNQELHLTLEEEVKGKDCLILTTVAPPEENLFSLLILADTLKKEGAHSLTALLPYLAYSRHDRPEEKKSRIAGLLGKLFVAAGIDEVVTFDIHSSIALGLFPLNVRSLSPAPLFAQLIEEKAFSNEVTLVAPDEGAIPRCQEVAKALGRSANVTSFSKKRTPEGIELLSSEGPIRQRTVVIDDILDTGKTLLHCCRELVQRGCREILILVTHGLFTGQLWKELWDYKVTAIYCTDTVPLAPELASEERIIVLPLVAQLLGD